MRKTWVHRLLAVSGLAACICLAGQVHAQDLLERNPKIQGQSGAEASFGPEYQAMFKMLAKMSEALQGSTDSASTAANLSQMPEKMEGSIEAKAFVSGDTSRENSYSRVEGEKTFKGQAFLAWLISKDFNLDDPFDALLKQRHVETLNRRQLRESEIDSAAEAAGIPQFTYLAGITHALDAMMIKDKDLESTSIRGVEKDSRDLDPLTFLTTPSAAKE